MDFYVMLPRDWPEDYSVRHAPRHRLPRVRYPACGHVLWWETGSLPLDIAAHLGASVRPNTEREAHVITPEEWTEIERRTAEAFRSVGRAVPHIYPGYAVGPLVGRVAYKRRLPDFLDAMPFRLFSERLLSLLTDAGVGGFEAYPARLEARGAKGAQPPDAYYEVLPCFGVPLAPEAGLVEERCAVCGMAQKREYRALLPDLTLWDGGDFVRVEGLFGTYVSGRVKTAVERAGIAGVLFLPCARLGVYPGAPTQAQIIYNLRAEERLRDAQGSEGHT